MFRFRTKGGILLADPQNAAAYVAARQQLVSSVAEGERLTALPVGWPNQSMAELVGQGIVDPDELWED